MTGDLAPHELEEIRREQLEGWRDATVILLVDGVQPGELTRAFADALDQGARELANVGRR